MQRIKQTLARWTKSSKYQPPGARSEQTKKSMSSGRLDSTTTSSTQLDDAPEPLARLDLSGNDAPLGACILYDGVDGNIGAVDIDIVFVHDLHGHRENSWTKSDVCWPKDLLSGDIPGIRVISWGWDLGATSEPALAKVADESSIADRMLEDLVKLRRGVLETRSIIFIAHGYGGIVVKEAISTAAISRIYGNGAHTGVATIYAHLIGIMFLGTVHLAIPGQSIGQTLAEVSRLNPHHENSTLSSFMEAQSDFFEKVVTDFNLFTRDVQIVCILEDRPTPSGQMVSKEAATHEEGPSVTIDTIRADHFDIARFSRRSDSGYFQILGHLSRMIQGPSSSDAAEVKEQRCQDILDLLYFEGMFEKEHTIDMENEYQSISSQTLSAKAPGEIDSTFHRWSNSNQPLMWVSGRQGCGKSTLMKYAFYHDAGTQSGLERWADGGRALKVIVCLFEDGSQLQKTHEGILRSTLYQILIQRKDLISAAFPAMFRGSSPPTASLNTIVNLTQALWGVFAHESHRLRLAVFIDGLDSYRQKEGQPETPEEKALADDQSTNSDEDNRQVSVAERAWIDHGYREITQLVKSMADQERIKLCVSSRELPIFSEAFESVPRLHIQDQYEEAIVKYCAGRLDEDNVSNIADANPLCHEVAQKSRGDIVWARLAMDVLLERSLKTLRSTLQALPERVGGPNGLYMYMLQGRGPKQQRGAAYVFQFMARASKTSLLPLSLLNLAFALEGYRDEEGGLRALDQKDVDLTQKELQGLGDQMAHRIETCCVQLVGIEGSTLEPGQRVVFVHPAAKDFATRRDVCDKLFGDAPGEFPDLIDVDLSLLSSHIRLVQCFQPGVLRPFMQTVSYNRPQVCPEAWILIIGALRCAARVESELRGGLGDDDGRKRTYVTLLNHLDSTCQRLWAESLKRHQPISGDDEEWKRDLPGLCHHHWAGFEPMERGKSPKRTSFLTLAIQANLVLYVSHALEPLSRGQPSSTGKSPQLLLEELLRAAVVPAGPSTSDAIPASQALVDDYRAPHTDFPATALAEAVLQHGRATALLDLRSPAGARIWAGLIRARRHCFASRPGQARRTMARLLAGGPDCNAALRRNQERWAAGVRALLAAGADAQMPIEEDGGGGGAGSAHHNKDGGHKRAEAKTAAVLIRETLVAEAHFAEQLKEIEELVMMSRQGG
ncbi:uncharacterized protein PG998_004319 [Apiospora kogelbergensis]|uniref:uncharacterized protein n=1 Tax=Apiospora kogelbergensis TaxID=1337665 RepID=UPI00312F1634